MSKLHEIIAVAKDRAVAAELVLNETQTTFSKKPDHFIGRHSIYKPLEEKEGGEDAEEATKELVDTVLGKLTHCFSVVAKSVDLEIMKDLANQQAAAPVVVDGVEITPPLPATSLLYLEGKIKKWLEMFTTIPTLPPGRRWELDPGKGAGVYIDPVPETRWRTKKAVQHKVLYEATENHPAQVEKWNEDVRVGKTLDTMWSSMYTPADKAKLISKAQELLVAVKAARQRANEQEVPQMSVCASLVNYLLK